MFGFYRGYTVDFEDLQAKQLEVVSIESDVVFYSVYLSFGVYYERARAENSTLGNFTYKVTCFAENCVAI